MKQFARRLLFPALVPLVQSSSVSAQARSEFAAGIGLGATGSGSPNPMVVDIVAFANVNWHVAHAIRGGVELWWGYNDDRVGAVSQGSPLRRSFPVFIGVAPTVSTRIASVAEVGVGPGVFERYYSSDEKSLVAGVVAQISANVFRTRYLNALISVRPFVGPPVSGRTAWVLPLTVGLSR